ncbi:M48 family metalloprotease [Actinomadura sp. 21ATH]|uniref:M48 family metalloprotease n=1 Tax=Actinomadura sp. 21ATH TaxID=1735444 RepID=UPI0035C11870
MHEVRHVLPRPRRTRHLCIGVPLLMELTTEQLRAVLAHELAHYAGHHAPFSRVVYRGSALLRLAARAQRAVFGLYIRLYDQVTLAIRREHEFEADRIAATVLDEYPDIGGFLMAEALHASHDLGLLWQLFLEDLDSRSPETRPCPQDLYPDFAAAIADPERLQTWKDSISSRPDIEVHHTDGSTGRSHPALPARLKELDPSGLSASAVPDAADRAGVVLLEERDDFLPPVARTILQHRYSTERPDEAESLPVTRPRLNRPLTAVLLFLLLYVVLFLAAYMMRSPGLLTTIMIGGNILLPVVLVVTGLTEPLDQHRTLQPRRRIRRWLDLTTGLCAVYVAWAYLNFVTYSSPLISLWLLLLAPPLLWPKVAARLPVFYRVLTCSLTWIIFTAVRSV